MKSLRLFYDRYSHKTGFIVAAFILFWPFGLYLLWKHRKLTFKSRSIITAVFAGLTLLIGIGTYNSPPYITVGDEALLNGYSTDDSYVVVKGRVSNIHTPTVTVNDELAELSNSGGFEHRLDIDEGDTTVTIVSKSVKGEDIKKFQVHRTTAAEFAERARIKKEKRDKVLAVAAKAASEKEEAERRAKEKNAAEKQERDLKEKLAQQLKPTGDLYQVTSIVDGDTIKVKINGETETIRFIGMDTPETKDPRKPVQCFGREASSKMQSFVQSKKVRLESDSSQGDRDKYGRLLRYVYTENGANVAYEMIRGGYAHEYTYNLPYKYQKQFKEAQRLARDSNSGLWSPSTCNGLTNQQHPPEPAPAPKPAPKPAPAPRPVAPPASVYYKNCTAARAAGAAPVYRGQPGYGTHLDRDRDGIGCE